ncbi:MAG: DUF5067 domain-containing protein [Corynebacterium glucuronolyticum]|nr:DUF5067 domain-containing protein [Corynebacterium glucuronolyticum]
MTTSMPEGQAPQAPAHKGITITGIIGLVISVMGLLLCWIPIVNNVAPIFGVGGIILSAIAIYSTRPAGKARGRGLAITGVVIGVISIAATLATQAIFGSMIDDAFGTDESSSQASSVSSADSNSSKEDAATGDLGEEGDLDTFHAKIVDGAASVADFEGAPTFATTVEVSNLQESENLNPFDVHVQAFQNGVELETAVYGDVNPDGYDAEDAWKELQPGGSNSFVSGFVLQDETNPVTIQVQSTMSFKDQKLTKTFSLN